MLCPHLRHYCPVLKQSESSNPIQRLAKLIIAHLLGSARPQISNLVFIFSRQSSPIPGCPNTTSPSPESLFRKCKPAPSPILSLISKRQSRIADHVPDDPSRM